MSPAGASDLVYAFPDYNTTHFGLTRGSDGNLYGVLTGGGGTSNIYAGTIFKVAPSGAYSLLYTFCTSHDSNGYCIGGTYPEGELIQGVDGEFYGTTNEGGANGGPYDTQGGTIFKISSSGTLTTLYNFCNQGGSACTDGELPISGLVQANDGNFYGTTGNGGIACPADPGTRLVPCQAAYDI